MGSLKAFATAATGMGSFFRESLNTACFTFFRAFFSYVALI